jgi:hypothetical protein
MKQRMPGQVNRGSAKSRIEVWLLLLCCLMQSAFCRAQATAFDYQSDKPVEKAAGLSNEYLLFQKKTGSVQKTIVALADVKNRELSLVTRQTPTAGSDHPAELEQKVLEKVKIQAWKDTPLKGKVRQTFDNAVASGNRDALPFEFHYTSVASPDFRYLLIYRYDYSQPTLLVSGKILDPSFSVKYTFGLPIDGGLTSHQLFINNQADVFLLSTDDVGSINLFRYTPESQESKLLQIGPSESQRNSFLPYLRTDQTILVANTSENAAGELTGVVVSIFNFQTGRVEDVQLHLLSQALLSKVSKKMPQGHYEIVAFAENERSEKRIELEKRNIAATNYHYNPSASNRPDQWKPRKQQAQIGEKIILIVNAAGKVTEELKEHYQTY